MAIIRGFPILSQDLIRIASKGRVAVGANPMARANAQYERILGAAPPGASARLYRPHDHSGNGGLTLARGTIASFDVGSINNSSHVSHTLAASATWETMRGATPEHDYVFGADVTAGLTGVLSCHFVALTYGNSVDFRVTNNTTGSSSTHSATPASAVAYHGVLTDIPKSAGVRNEFDFEIRGTLGDTLDLLGFCLYESTANQPASAGSTTYSSL